MNDKLSLQNGENWNVKPSRSSVIQAIELQEDFGFRGIRYLIECRVRSRFENRRISWKRSKTLSLLPTLQSQAATPAHTPVGDWRFTFWKKMEPKKLWIPNCLFLGQEVRHPTENKEIQWKTYTHRVLPPLSYLTSDYTLRQKIRGCPLRKNSPSNECCWTGRFPTKKAHPLILQWNSPVGTARAQTIWSAF